MTTTYQYDDDNRLVKTIYPDNTFTQTDYNSIGQKIDQIDQDGRMTQFDYDPAGRLWHVTNPIATEVTTFGYDEIGNKIWQQDANGHTTHFAYDGMGRLVGKALPDGTRTEGMTYNPDGTLATTTDYNGHVTTYGYDPQTGRQTSVSHDDGTGVSYTYNADGSKHTQTRVNAGGTVTQTYSYDANRGWLTSVATQTTSSAGTVTNTVSYTYDDAGNKLTMQDGSGTTHYTYDADNRLKTVIAPDGATTTYAYDQIGNRASVARPNGVTTTYAYNELSRLVTLTNSAGPSFQYVLDAAGKRQQMIDSVNGTTTYGYDGDGRLTSEAGPGGTHSYYYDKVGNRVQEDSTAYTYDADDRNTAYSYDANGNVLNNGTLTMTYDEDNEVVSAGGNTYLYDADGTRVQATTTAGVTNYVVDGSEGLPVVVEERDDSNNLLADYVYGDDLIRMDRNSNGSWGTYYYIFDGSGSTRALTSSAGGVTDTWTYDAFGNATRSTTVNSGVYNPYLYDGQEQDNTGLYYLRARYYNPQDGRFVSQDPFSGNDSDPISLHRYLYASDDPVSNIDPGGNEDSSIAAMTTAMDISSTLDQASSSAAFEAQPLVAGKFQEWTLYIRTFAPWKTFGLGFGGDNRTFTTDRGPNVTSRITGILKFRVTGSVTVLSENAYQDPSRWGPLSKTDTPTFDYQQPLGNSLFIYEVGSDALIYFALPIRVYLDLNIISHPGNFTEFDGHLHGTAFPDFEVFVVNQSNQATMLYTFATSGGRETGPYLYLSNPINLDMGGFSEWVRD